MHRTWVMASRTRQPNYILCPVRATGSIVGKKKTLNFPLIMRSRQYFHPNKEVYEAMQIETLYRSHHTAIHLYPLLSESVEVAMVWS